METAYQYELKQLRRRQKREREEYQKHENLMAIAEEYAEKFSPYNAYQEDKTLRYTIVSYEHLVWQRASLKLCLAKQDKADSANPIIGALIKDPRLDMKQCPEKELEDTETAVWIFKPKGSVAYSPMLKVAVSYERSESCKLVPTGKFSEPYEITKMVCS